MSQRSAALTAYRQLLRSCKLTFKCGLNESSPLHPGTAELICSCLGCLLRNDPEIFGKAHFEARSGAPLPPYAHSNLF
jgi:hypothetical protein